MLSSGHVTSTFFELISRTTAEDVQKTKRQVSKVRDFVTATVR